MTMVAMPSKTTTGTNNSLIKRISTRKDQIQPWCNNCNHPGHWTSKCQRLASNKCYNCGKYGHHTKDCWAKPKKGGNNEKRKNWKEKKKGKDNNNNSNDEQTNAVMEVAFPIQVEEDNIEMHNISTYDACNLEGNDECLIWYDWVADSATTSHITHQREAFINYTPSKNASVTGVGGQKVKIAGRGVITAICIEYGSDRDFEPNKK